MSKDYGYPSFELICKASSGDEMAVKEILKFYDGYISKLCLRPFYHSESEYSCAVTPQVRQTGNRLSGNAGTAYASLLA